MGNSITIKKQGYYTYYKNIDNHSVKIEYIGKKIGAL